MASSNLHIPLLLTLLIVTTSLGESLINQEEEFKGWVSWNMEKFRKRGDVDHPTTLGSLEDGGLDQELVAAEKAMVSYIVSQDGSGDYKSIMEAIESIPLKNKRRIVLEIRPGIYREKIVIPKSKPFITFLGNPDDPPILTGNDTAGTKGRDGKLLETFNSSTVAINAMYYIAYNIIFENTAPYPEVGQDEGQAVALRISGDKAAFYNCSFYSTQDTLYDHKGRHYFNNCFIQGSVDFICGYGTSLYENCYLNSIAKTTASITAQKRTNKTMESGFSFVKSRVSGSSLVYLGRAWGDHSRVVFSNTFMEDVVLHEGWDSWNVTQPQTSGIYYGEYNCSGPGANFTGRVPWAHMLTYEEAQPFLGTYYIDGESWLSGPPTI